MSEAEERRQIGRSLVDFTIKRRFPTTEALSAARLGAIDVPLARDAFKSAQIELQVWLI